MITVSGNVTRDPELRFTPSGQGVCSFSVAVNRSWQNRQTQEWEEATSFFDVTCWGDLGDNVSESLSKGSRVIVTGTTTSGCVRATVLDAFSLTFRDGVATDVDGLAKASAQDLATASNFEPERLATIRSEFFATLSAAAKPAA